MIIKSSSIGMESARTYTSVSAGSYHASGNLIAFPGILADAYGTKEKQDVSKEEESKKGSDERTDAGNAGNDFDSIYSRMKSFAASENYGSKLMRDAMNRIRVECIQFLLYMLFGERGSEASRPAVGGTNKEDLMVTEVSETYKYYRSETEETCFSTTGKVVTSDGRELDFNLELSMSRSFTEYYEQNVSVLKTFTDPLVINIDSPVAQVEDVTVSFDLDCDGEAETVSALSGGSGYLALDRDMDGVINDGSELFGTSSGDGFADLARYDLDGNGWIDEADEIFDRLVIAYIKEDGSQELVRLKDKDIGAIFTGSVSTDFSLNDPATNEGRARIRQTGIFLYENGMTGTVQHLDLAQ